MDVTSRIALQRIRKSRHPCGRSAVRQAQHPAVAQHHFDRRSAAASNGRLNAVLHRDRCAVLAGHPLTLPATGLASPDMQKIGVNVAAWRNLGDAALAVNALLDDPQPLGRSPSPPSLRTSKPSSRRHVCPLIRQLTDTRSHADKSKR